MSKLDWYSSHQPYCYNDNEDDHGTFICDGWGDGDDCGWANGTGGGAHSTDDNGFGDADVGNGDGSGGSKDHRYRIHLQSKQFDTTIALLCWLLEE